ncbi:hypothetical protein [Amycolatopsis orientalis]|uniref:hypothetical protein n=1 Tax=Amycolatopsis orientalis TaxID=31958 RepID=UPI0003A7C12C|nr:hypothetical protein [Amycolatopsis orientalis]
MRSARISRRAAEAAYDGTDENYDVLAAQDWVSTAVDPFDVLDAAVEETELFLSAAELAAMHDYLHDFRGQRDAGRRKRRAGRAVVRTLPSAVRPISEVESEAA